MPAPPIETNAKIIDLSGRIAQSAAVVASPTGSTETIIASVTIPDDITIVSGVYVTGWAAFTVGTSGVTANLRVRQTNASGTIVKASGGLTVTATNLVAPGIHGYDTAATAGGIYVLTLTVGSGAATSTVSAVQLFCICI